MYPGYNAQQALQEARVRELEQDAATEQHTAQPNRFALLKGWLHKPAQVEQPPPQMSSLRPLTRAKIAPEC